MHTMTTEARGIDVPCDCQRGQDHHERLYDVPIPTVQDGSEITGDIVLELPMEPNGADARTVREYLSALVMAVWIEKEGFSGKRPFGDSSWDYDLIEALFQAGFLPGDHPEPGWGHTDEQNTIGDRLIRLAIDALGVSPSAAQAHPLDGSAGAK